MDYANPDALLGTQWLADHLGDADVRVIDATFFLPNMGRDGASEFEACHIPGAVYFDIDDIADADNPLPHMLPDAPTFAAKVGALGIDNASRVVAYDASGGFLAAARAWWMFRVFGHGNVAVLDGGLPKWRQEDRPIESGRGTPQAARFTATKDESLVRDARQVIANLDSAAEQVIDARSPGRFMGTEPEPRPGLRTGHIPGSLNVPVPALMDPADTFTLRPADDLAAAFQGAGVDMDRPAIATCGSGVTACVPALALYLLGHDRVAVYDGSWAEWGARDDTPAETTQ